MKLLFLGTGAADKMNIEELKKDAFPRRCSSALLTGGVLMDPGPHIYDFAESAGTPALFRDVRQVLCTHSHDDHFCPQTLARLAREATGRVTVYGDGAILRRMRREMGESAGAVDFRYMHHGERVTVGAYEVLPVRSNHSTADEAEITLHYIIEGEGKRLFYGLDGAWLRRESWNLMRALPGAFDVMIFDLTCGENPDEFRFAEHNSIPMLRLMLAGMKNKVNHVVDGSTRFYASHMASTLHTDPDTLRRTLAPDGIIPAYDGMEIEI